MSEEIQEGPPKLNGFRGGIAEDFHVDPSPRVMIEEAEAGVLLRNEAH